LHPRRTIRVVFWVNEENGGAGGRAYREMVGDAALKHVAAIEMDGGAEKPVGFGFGSGMVGRRRAVPSPEPEVNIPPTTQAAFDRVVEIGKLLEPIDGGKISPGGGGADIAPLMMTGVPGLGVRTVGTHYFDWHHTDADSFDKLVPSEFNANVASLAVMSFVLADMPERLSDMK
jgi:Zn-dependent M28 family amino/carboxypeptidase